MIRSIGILVLLALAASMPALEARAFTAIVPDDYPGIQAAHDAGATVIQVRAGVWPGSIVITHDCTIEPAAAVPPGWWTPFPWIQGDLAVVSTSPPTPEVIVRGMRIGGVVTTDGFNMAASNTFLDCRVDSGIVISGGSTAYVRHCIVTHGGIRSHGSWSTHLLANTVVGGIEVTSSEAGARIEGNFVIGPATYGILGSDTDGDVTVTGNVVEGTNTGISFYGGYATKTLEGNDVSGCTEAGIVASFAAGTGSVLDNRVTDCGGHGIVARAEAPFGNPRLVIRRNVVANVSGHGITVTAPAGSLTDNTITDAQGAGVHVADGSALDSLAGNRILRAGAAGMDLASAGDVRLNVVGRCGADGIRIAASPAGLVLERNTSYLNGGDGYDVANVSSTTVVRNLAHGNSGHGLGSGGSTPALSCNDWFGNALGATSGVTPDPSDLDVNPEFCGLAADDVTLAATSPLATGPCAIVGARGVGCAGVVGVIGAGPPPRRLTASPSPAAADVSFAFPPSGSAATLEVFDAAGAVRRRARVSSGATAWPWDLRDDAGRAVPVGVYFARWTSGSERFTTRVVIAR